VGKVSENDTMNIEETNSLPPKWHVRHIWPRCDLKTYSAHLCSKVNHWQKHINDCYSYHRDTNTDIRQQLRWPSRLQLFELKIGAPVTPVMESIQTNCGFSTPVCFELKTRTGQTDRQTCRTHNAAYRMAT